MTKKNKTAQTVSITSALFLINYTHKTVPLASKTTIQQLWVVKYIYLHPMDANQLINGTQKDGQIGVNWGLTPINSN